MSIYIDSATQITNQQPLCDDWMENPLWPTSRHCRFVKPDFKKFLSPIASRRMETAIKCAVSSALSCIEQSGMQAADVDAILTGTGLGCIESTEHFLNAMIDDGEENLSPTNFIQSTHNTIGSQIAIAMKCHGYNISYSHRGTSFDSALLDAVVKFQQGGCSSALVNGVDEMTDKYFQMFDKLNVWRKTDPTSPKPEKNASGAIAGENSVSFLLRNTKTDHTLCELTDTLLLHRPTDERLAHAAQHLLEEGNIRQVDGIVLGKDGGAETDAEYDRVKGVLGLQTPTILYKHLFGTSFTMAAVGLYVAARCLQKNAVPSFLFEDGRGNGDVRSLLVVNHFQKTDYSLTLLKLC